MTPQSALSRRRFLKGDLRPAGAPIRPPWALAEARFVEQCTRCDRCMGACPEGILRRGSGGFPEADFALGACTFEGACVDACEPGALQSPQRDRQSAWRHRAVIGEGCLAARGILCRVCGDACEEGAIRFRPRPGGREECLVEVARCTGCGACVQPCPSRAVSMKPLAEVNGRCL